MFINKFEPFIDPFRDFFIVKFSIFTTGILASLSGFMDLFQTDLQYAYLLFSLILLDSAGKVISMYFINHDDQEEFDFALMIQKMMYKSSSYFIVCLAFVMFSNQFEPEARRLEYGVFFGLSLLELYSIAKHFKILGYLVAIIKQIYTGEFNAAKLREEAEKYNVKKLSD